MKRTVRVVAGLFRRGSTVLVQQRPAGKSRGGLWEFPGGKVEPGETDERALARECHEELSVEVSVRGKLAELSHEYEDLTVELALYEATMADDATPRPNDAQALAWVERGELPALPFCDADVPLLPRLASGEL